jgi:hypothetical protein
VRNLIFAVPFFAASIPGAALANDTSAQGLIPFTRSYLECFGMDASDTVRLSCFDALADRLSGDLKAETSSAEAGAPACKVENWASSMRGSHLFISGATSCAKGRIDYRLYDDADFVASGFSYFQGFAFQAYADTGAPAGKLSIKYTIEAQ